MTDTELASYIVSLEERVARLKTLEDTPQGSGGWTFITETELASAAASVTLSSIPSTYDDLMLIWQTRSTTVALPNRDYLVAQFNGDTTAGNYDTTETSQSGAGVCFRDSGYVMIGHCPSASATGDANTFGGGLCYFPEYSGTSYKKVNEGWDANADLTSVFGLNGQCNGNWNSTAVITSIKLYLQRGGNLLADSRFELYGLTR